MGYTTGFRRWAIVFWIHVCILPLFGLFGVFWTWFWILYFGHQMLFSTIWFLLHPLLCLAASAPSAPPTIFGCSLVFTARPHTFGFNLVHPAPAIAVLTAPSSAISTLSPIWQASLIAAFRRDPKFHSQGDTRFAFCQPIVRVPYAKCIVFLWSQCGKAAYPSAHRPHWSPLHPLGLLTSPFDFDSERLGSPCLWMALF